MLRPEQVYINKTLLGDIEAFECLINMHQGQLFSFIYKLTSSREDSEEILQDVFVKVYNNLFRYDNEYSFSTWIYRIAINTFKNAYKKKKNTPSLLFIEDFEREFAYISDTPEAAFEIKEFYNEIINLLNYLKEDEKIIFMLKYFKDFTYKEIGEVIGISSESAKMKVYRCKNTLVEKYNVLKKRGMV